MYTQTGEQTACFFFLISKGAQLGAQFIKMLAGCFKIYDLNYPQTPCLFHFIFYLFIYFNFHVSATEIFNPGSKEIPGQHENRCYSVYFNAGFRTVERTTS